MFKKVGMNLDEQKLKLKELVTKEASRINLNDKYSDLLSSLNRKIDDLYTVNSIKQHNEKTLFFLKVEYIINPTLQKEFDGLFSELEGILIKKAKSL